ncbi:MAG: rRNA pseudouridine synthase [Gammaproteobacteria bacterium]|nr:MAG: rRNA pseudouridine synthase [Gammaproteobacteria bacterium]
MNNNITDKVPIRLSKLMSQQGICSRREADRYIEQGLVMVDGKPVDKLGTKIYPNQHISLAKSASAQQRSRITILLNKPVGIVSGQAEAGYKPAIRLILPQNQYLSSPWEKKKFSTHILQGLAPAGRLDIDSRGLLVLTQDGVVAKQLIGADSLIEKEYLVWVKGKITDEGLNRLRHGIQLDGKKLKQAKVHQLNPTRLKIILKEGKKRQIRRMCEEVDLTVTGLTRTRIGNIKLGDMPTGQWRYLRDDEEF